MAGECARNHQRTMMKMVGVVVIQRLLCLVVMLQLWCLDSGGYSGSCCSTNVIAFQALAPPAITTQRRQWQWQQRQQRQQQPPTTSSTTIASCSNYHPMLTTMMMKKKKQMPLMALFSSSSDNNNENNENNDDDGINLAAEFLKMAKAKGIELQEDDLLDDDEEEDDKEEDLISKQQQGGTRTETSLQQQQQESDDDDDDDEEEINIPQGAINAFLGYDTGDVGEKLAGNVTLTNDQLYSEVKERVLESAGGFVDYLTSVRGDDDDEEEDDEEEDSSRVVENLLQQVVSTPSSSQDSSSLSSTSYQPPLVVPDSDLTAGEVVLTVLEALLHNDVPTPNRGVEILFGYSSPNSQIQNEVGLTPIEYADFLKDTEYKVLFDHQDVTIDKGDYSFDGKKAYFTARLRVGPGPLDVVSVNFILSTTGVEDDACWLIDSILIRPQAMRRRRRR